MREAIASLSYGRREMERLLSPLPGLAKQEIITNTINANKAAERKSNDFFVSISTYSNNK
jgi:hypothetical protein